MTSGLRIDDLHFSYGNTGVLNGLSMALKPSEICAVIGESGAGKSSLLKCLLQTERASKGRVDYEGVFSQFGCHSRTEAELQAIRRQIGYVPQSSLLFPHLSVLRNVMFPLVKAHGFRKEQAEARATASLERIGLEALAVRYPWQLSGGQQQRVAFARAHAVQPSLYLLDEPTAALDVGTSRKLGRVLKEDIQQRGASALIATHNLGFARVTCDSIALLSGGTISWHLAIGEVELERAMLAIT